ncbi:MAG TPA: hypothetical protein VF209_01435 [Patescibacteria group bacterium]
MTEKKLLIGSLSNDLLRVATLTQRGSNQAAERFFLEAKKWAEELSNHELKEYIAKIVKDIQSETSLTLESAEKFLMYSILLQNYSLQLE